ncbi:MAG TPA: HlyD family efflux transporter periplasmic adaptor subunit [Gemmatimonadaceae bacterium]|nr:HlyD family efflux transporter periplasmic adaptor subunit [Gemmatimonadaceae bacterium]
MDIKRDPPKKTKKYVYGGIAIVGVALITMALSRMEPAAPSVERGTLWIDTVRRGEMIRQVRGPGTLVPEQIRYISALTAGRIEALPLRPGVTVTSETVILEMSNPDVQLEALEAQRQLSAAEAQLVTLRTSLQSDRLNQESQLAQVNREYQDAVRQAEVQEALDKRGLTSAAERDRAKELAQSLETRLRLERERLAVLTNSIERQIALQEQQVQRMRAVAQFQQDRIASMKVRAGSDGVLQALPLELGQWVVSGEQLARVAQPGRLKAVLRIPETQAKDVVVGQPSSIDTRNGIIKGRVMRIDPAAENGTVGVEVALEGELPRGARPDLSVDGTIEIERLSNVMYVGRPAYGQAESTVGIFKLDPDRKTASRVNVRLGRSSVNTIEVVQGLNVGDLVIISDMSAWDAQERVRLR